MLEFVQNSSAASVIQYILSGGYILLRQIISFIKQNYLGHSVEVRALIDSDIRGQSTASRQGEVRILLENMDSLRLEMMYHYNIELALGHVCQSPMTEWKLCKIFKRKIETTLENTLLIAILHNINSGVFADIQKGVKSVTDKLPEEQTLKILPTPLVIDNMDMVVNTATVTPNNCYNWDGHKCYSKWGERNCRFTHTPGVDTRRNDFSAGARNRDYSRSRSRDRGSSSYGRDYSRGQNNRGRGAHVESRSRDRGSSSYGRDYSREQNNCGPSDREERGYREDRRRDSRQRENRDNRGPYYADRSSSKESEKQKPSSRIRFDSPAKDTTFTPRPGKM